MDRTGSGLGNTRPGHAPEISPVHVAHNFYMRSLSTKLATAASFWAARDLYNLGKRYVIPTKKFSGARMPYQRSYARYPRRRRYRRGYRRARKFRKRSSYRRKRVRFIGYPIGSGTCKRVLTQNVSGQSLDTRTLYSRNLTFLAQGTANDINTRQRQMINLRGFKIRFNIQTLTGAQRWYFHWALIAEKSRTRGIPESQDNAISGTNFFRGNGSSRGIDFQNSLSGNEINFLGINQDEYVVLKHKRMLLDPVSTNGDNHQWQRHVSMYIPIKRQVRYDPSYGDCPTDGAIWSVWWCEGMNGVGSGATPQTNWANIDQFVVTYFREPAC